MVQNLGVSGKEAGFFLNVLLTILGEGISNSIMFLLIINNPKMIFQQLLTSRHLDKAQAFFVIKGAQVVVVYKNENLMFAIF